MPAATFITCFLALIDINTGIVQFANAGQSLPIHSSKIGISELRATGMPLGLMESMEYEEYETRLIPGDSLLFYSDGLIEAHFPDGSMFGRELLHKIVEDNNSHPDLISVLLSHLSGTAGNGIEQEDDITLVLVRCSSLMGA
jgi:serine phosphatase RsbU (regulator of sigma subunit)